MVLYLYLQAVGSFSFCERDADQLLTLRWPKEGGGVDAALPKGFESFSRKWEELPLQTKFLTVDSSLEHLPMKNFFRSDLPSSPIEQKLTYFASHEDGIQS